MNETKKLTMVFSLDNGDEYNITLSDPKDELTKTEVDTVMQKIIDTSAVIKDGHSPSAIKECYITTTTKDILE